MARKRTDLRQEVPRSATPKPGYLIDFISGREIRATPEKTQAVQVFSRRLVEDYGDSTAEIQTRPQHRMRKRPSEEEKSYPINIAVFRSSKRSEGELFMVADCKAKDCKDGEHRVRLCLDMSAACPGRRAKRPFRGRRKCLTLRDTFQTVRIAAEMPGCAVSGW